MSTFAVRLTVGSEVAREPGSGTLLRRIAVVPSFAVEGRVGDVHPLPREILANPRSSAPIMVILKLSPMPMVRSLTVRVADGSSSDIGIGVRVVLVALGVRKSGGSAAAVGAAGTCGRSEIRGHFWECRGRRGKAARVTAAAASGDWRIAEQLAAATHWPSHPPPASWSARPLPR